MNFKKELLGRKMTVLELDNYMQEELSTNESLFDEDVKEYIYNNKSYAYKLNEDDYLNVEWEIIKDNEDILKVVVKITDIDNI